MALHNAISHTYHSTLSRFERNMSHSIWFFLFFLCYTFPCKHAFVSTHRLCPHDQMKALLEFKDRLTIDEDASEGCSYVYPKTMSWDSKSGNNSDCCLWDGVTCDKETGHVIELDLSCSQLDGPIDDSNISHGLFHLTHLRRLNLAYNFFADSYISPAFGRFTNLTHLNLSTSAFFGSIPIELSLLSELNSIDVSDNNYVSVEANDFDSLLKNLTHLRELVFRGVLISSSIPNSLMNMSSLEIIDLTYCGLHGILPGQIFMFPHLRALSLGGNNLRGDIPEISSTNTSSLQILDMGFNDNLFGRRGLPDSVGNLKSLRYLDLSNTNLAELPNSIGSLTSLISLQLSFGNLSGSIPKSIGNLTQLTYLDLSYNSLSGSIPKSIGNLTHLTKLDLYGNRLSGSIPKSIGNLTELTYLNMSDNNLYGAIPKSIGNLTHLTNLGMLRNSLSGAIPKSFGALTHLTKLDLYGNRLSCSIPKSIGNLTHLTNLDLSYNNLSGSIPKSIGNLTHLTNLDLSYNNLSGSIPKSIGSLTHLTNLDLSYNSLSGSIPKSIGNLTHLTNLDLGFNQLTGPIPDIQNGSSLESIYLNDNSLQGTIPHSFVNSLNLVELDLSSNKLNGTVEPLLFSKLETLTYLYLSRNFLQGSFPVLPVSICIFIISHNKFSGLPVSLSVLLTSHNDLSGDIPASICNLTNLVILDVSYNDFGGEIPQCLVNKNSLLVLDLQKNRFSGTIPPISANSLTTLNLNDNHFEGPIPESLINCKELELLDLGKNKLNGSFPHWLETFSQLQVLVLHSNKFQGHVGTSKTISTYPKLRIFDLSDNEFTGLLPARYFQNFTAMKNTKETEGEAKYMESVDSYYHFSTALVWNGVEVVIERILTTLAAIDLSDNNFEGQIPEALQELNSLRMLNLSHNSLTGSIPASLGNLSNLQILDLSSNILTGTIPIQLASITFLAKFNVSYNHLVGPIPQGSQFKSFENNSYIENLGLCGFPLSHLCGYKKPPSPKVTKQKKDQSIFHSGFTWEIVLFGYGCGVPFGLILGFLMFFVGWPRWFLRIAGPQNGRPRRRRNHT